MNLWDKVSFISNCENMSGPILNKRLNKKSKDSDEVSETLKEIKKIKNKYNKLKKNIPKDKVEKIIDQLISLELEMSLLEKSLKEK